jgi:hypothetical protein
MLGRCANAAAGSLIIKKAAMRTSMFSTLVAVFSYVFNGAQLRAKRTVTGFETYGRPGFAYSNRGRRGAAVGLLTAALVLLGSAAYAHSWYPNDCCHDADCRPVPCDELVETRNGIMWRGVVLFNDAQVKASQDRFCHVCAKEQVGTLLPYLPLCAFIQPSS